MLDLCGVYCICKRRTVFKEPFVMSITPTLHRTVIRYKPKKSRNLSQKLSAENEDDRTKWLYEQRSNDHAKAKDSREVHIGSWHQGSERFCVQFRKKCSKPANVEYIQPQEDICRQAGRSEQARPGTG